MLCKGEHGAATLTAVHEEHVLEYCRYAGCWVATAWCMDRVAGEGGSTHCARSSLHPDVPLLAALSEVIKYDV